MRIGFVWRHNSFRICRVLRSIVAHIFAKITESPQRKVLATVIAPEHRYSRVAAMPTVLDFLRRQLLGDDAANKLELSLDILSARIFGRSQRKIQVNRNSSRANVEFLELARPSPGYEPLLMKMGWDQFAARGLAKFVVRPAKQRARESKLYRQVTKDIRILAKGPRQQAALIRCAQRLRTCGK